MKESRWLGSCADVGLRQQYLLALTQPMRAFEPGKKSTAWTIGQVSDLAK
jgi:hypothetical protein